jgi:hypothetical protein
MFGVYLAEENCSITFKEVFDIDKYHKKMFKL